MPGERRITTHWNGRANRELLMLGLHLFAARARHSIRALDCFSAQPLEMRLGNYKKASDTSEDLSRAMIIQIGKSVLFLTAVTFPLWVALRLAINASRRRRNQP